MTLGLIIALAVYIYSFSTNYTDQPPRKLSKIAPKWPFNSFGSIFGLKRKNEKSIGTKKNKIPGINVCASTSSGAASLVASSRNTDLEAPSSLMSSVEVPLLIKSSLMNHNGDICNLPEVNNLNIISELLSDVKRPMMLNNYGQMNLIKPNIVTGYSGNSSGSGFNSQSFNYSSITNGTSAGHRTDQTTLLSTDDDNFSSSGSGPPLLIQRSIARQIDLKKMIGKGRFGEVWKGQWRGDSVAVKIFSSLDETSWQREVEIYQTTMLRHENILGYISADNKDNGTFIQLWLVTEYHELGSLYDYLSDHTLTLDEMISMATSIATGLSHLHYEIHGLSGKPPIAHRDLKSKNILVKSKDTCVIADLGLAVRQLPDSRGVDLPSAKKVGTRRYLPPEVLSDENDTTYFEFDAFRMGDIYSFSLVLWELANRTTFTIDQNTSQPEIISANTYQLPYFDMVPSDPTIEEMKQIVVTEGKRPQIKDIWMKNEKMKRLSQIITECWTANPTARLPTFRAKKNLDNLKKLSVVNCFNSMLE